MHDCGQNVCRRPGASPSTQNQVPILDPCRWKLGEFGGVGQILLWLDKPSLGLMETTHFYIKHK